MPLCNFQRNLLIGYFVKLKETITEPGTELPQVDGKLLFSQFDLQKVLQNGASLLGSEGDQFNNDEKFTGNI